MRLRDTERESCLSVFHTSMADLATNEMVKNIRTPQVCQRPILQPLTEVIGMGPVFEFKFLKSDADEVVGGRVEALGYTIVFGVRKQSGGSGIIHPHAYSDVHL